MAKGTGNRLTDEQRTAIRNSDPTETLAGLAKKHNTSVATIQKYRAKRAGAPKQAAMARPRATNSIDAVLRNFIKSMTLAQRLELIGLKAE